MQTIHTLSRTLAITVATLLSLAVPAGAALVAAVGSPSIDTLSLSLSLAVDSSVPGQATLAYDLTLNSDAGAAWAVRDFSIIRDWSEGLASNLTTNRGWSGSSISHFIEWTGDAATALAEGDTAHFAYTVAAAVPASQMFVYYVTKDGGAPFQVVANDAATLVSAQVVPEPTALALVGIGLLGVWRRWAA